ncbi:hypothetical protein Y032_0005g2721 [Ancylostoma ceylanicum]|uniref:Uncharacterized protein n=1 Tax=Ancylostoma ceylanicum TaxID=53326 RepID=A0A016VSN7_9BILA|nr:hypothetical protein Y032_0005g2721 [Ancylostoma ceylanicum]
MEHCTWERLSYVIGQSENGQSQSSVAPLFPGIALYTPANGVAEAFLINGIGCVTRGTLLCCDWSTHDDDDPQQRRKGVYAIFQNIGNLMRDRRASESARITGSNDPIEVETDSAPDRPSSSVRAMAGSLRFRGRRDNRRSGEYREVPLEPPPCLAFKYGAPDGVRKPQLPAIFETPEASFADASYGATYKLPGPAVIGVNEDC